MVHFIISVFCLVLCEGGFLNSVQGMDKASLAMRGGKRLYSQSCSSLSDFNLTHHYAFPLSMTVLGKVFEKPDLLKFCVENLSGAAPLTNITVLKKASHHHQDFVFEAFNEKSNPVCITLTASETPRLYDQQGTLEYLDGCYRRKVKEWEESDSKEKYASYTAIHLFGETWEKPFKMGDALSLPYEATFNLDKSSRQHKTSTTYKRYILPTFLQPGYPYLDYPPNLLTNKESLLYVLKYAFLLGDVPLHLREIDPIEKMFQSLESTHWDAETWVHYARECVENAGFSCETYRLVDSVERIFKSWPLGMLTEPEGFVNMTLTSEQITPLINKCNESLREFAEVLLHSDRNSLTSPTYKGFPFAGYRREVCFRNKMGVLTSIVELHNGLEIAKQIRRNIQEKVDPQIILQNVRSKTSLTSEEESALSGYLGLSAPSV